MLNDFEATAFSLPHLSATDVCQIGGGRTVSGAPIAVLGPGTGLGVACYVPGSQSGIVLASEGGHATASVVSRREDAIVDYLRQQFDHVSAERVLSGPGLENLYRAVVALDGIDAPARNAAEITQAALNETCPAAKMALDLFCAILGTVAGNTALMFGARGGVYIAGGIVPRITEYVAPHKIPRTFPKQRTDFDAIWKAFRQTSSSIPLPRSSD